MNEAIAGKLARGPDFSFDSWTCPNELKICLCTTVYCRGENLIKALAINLVTLQFYVGLVTWIVVSFEDNIGDNAKVLEWIGEYAQWAIECGLLVFRVGTGMKEGLGWHCSIGKNTSHRVARELEWQQTSSAASSSSTTGMVGCATIPKHLMLVNLDGDNLPGQLFLQSLLRESASKMGDKTFCLWHHKSGCNQGGTCGRITMWAEKFYEMNGYDEDLLPSGYEDLDVMHRTGDKFQRIQAITEVGEAVPNEPSSSRLYSTGTFKLKYTTFALSLIHI